MHLVREADSLGVRTRPGSGSSAGEVRVARFIISGGTAEHGTVCQIEEPVKPTTVRTPNAAAARAVSASSAAARCRHPLGLAVAPDPGGRSLVRTSIGDRRRPGPTR